MQQSVARKRRVHAEHMARELVIRVVVGQGVKGHEQDKYCERADYDDFGDAGFDHGLVLPTGEREID